MAETWCYECNPAVLETAARPKIFLPLCEEHLAQVKPLSDEEIEKALEEGRKVGEEILRYSGYTRPPPRWP